MLGMTLTDDYVQESAAVGSDGIGSWGLQEAPTKRNYDKLPDSILKKHFDVARVVIWVRCVWTTDVQNIQVSVNIQVSGQN